MGVVGVLQRTEFIDFCEDELIVFQLPLFQFAKRWKWVTDQHRTSGLSGPVKGIWCFLKGLFFGEEVGQLFTVPCNALI